MEERPQMQRTRAERQPADGRRNRRRKKKRRLTGFAKTLIVIACALILFFIFFFASRAFFEEGSEQNLTGQTVTITIPEGSGTADIAQILKENGLIDSTFLFRLKSKINGYDGLYQQGTYDVDTGMTPSQIMELLQTGVVYNDLKLSVPEGYTTLQIAARVEELGICTADEFIKECNEAVFPYDFVQDLPDRAYRLEGYLFPDTYYFSEGTTAHEVIDVMLARFEKAIEPYASQISASSYSLDELITIASIIEREITLDEERPIASGVIYNRLNINMALQIDATVLYGQLIAGADTSSVNLQFESDYNTYLNPGLPVGPISNPGDASIQAALSPQSHQYIYYVLEAADKSNHIYCETYDEFLEAKAAYQATLQ